MQLGLFNGELFSLAIQITYIIQNSLYGYGETHFFLVVIIHDQVTYVRLYPKEQWAIHRKVSCLIREKQRWSALVNRLLSLFLSLFLCDVVKKNKQVFFNGVLLFWGLARKKSNSKPSFRDQTFSENREERVSRTVNDFFFFLLLSYFNCFSDVQEFSIALVSSFLVAFAYTIFSSSVTNLWEPFSQDIVHTTLQRQKMLFQSVETAWT